MKLTLKCLKGGREGGKDQLGENVYFHTFKFLTQSARVSVRAHVCVQDQQTL